MKLTRGLILVTTFSLIALAPASSQALFSHADDESDAVKPQVSRANFTERLRSIAERMLAAHDSLERKVTGPPTQQQQKEAIAQLDQLIQWLQDQNFPDNPPPPEGPKPPNPPPDPPAPPRPQFPPPNPPVDPLVESRLPEGEPPQTADEFVSRVRNSWKVDMPEELIKKVYADLKEKFPDRYREMLEEYFRQLSTPQK